MFRNVELDAGVVFKGLPTSDLSPCVRRDRGFDLEFYNDVVEGVAVMALELLHRLQHPRRDQRECHLFTRPTLISIPAETSGSATCARAQHFSAQLRTHEPVAFAHHLLSPAICRSVYHSLSLSIVFSLSLHQQYQPRRTWIKTVRDSENSH